MNKERPAIIERVKGDMVFALALIHHLYFVNHKTLGQIIKLLSQLTTRYMVVEFIDVGDDKVKLINQLQESDGYTKRNFLNEVSQYFSILETTELSDTRDLFVLEKLHSVG